MTVKEAIEKIHAPKGVTSVLAGVASGDFSVLNDQKDIEVSLLKSEEMILKYKDDLENCKSDWSYWSILGDLGYWKAVKDIVQAGLVNNGKLADVEGPDLNGCVVMDAISRVERFGKDVLIQTRNINTNSI